MPKKRFSAEQIVVLLGQIEVLMSQGNATPIACREAGIFAAAARRMPQRRNLLQPEGSHRRHRAMAQSIQHDPAALILELSTASTPNIHSPIASPGLQLPDAIVSIPLVQNIHQVITSGCPVGLLADAGHTSLGAIEPVSVLSN